MNKEIIKKIMDRNYQCIKIAKGKQQKFNFIVEKEIELSNGNIVKINHYKSCDFIPLSDIAEIVSMLQSSQEELKKVYFNNKKGG